MYNVTEISEHTYIGQVFLISKEQNWDILYIFMSQHTLQLIL